MYIKYTSDKGNVQQPGYLSGIALGYGLNYPGFESRQGLGIFPFTTASRSALGPTQPPIRGGKNGRCVKLTTHLHLVPKSRMRGAIPPLPQYAVMAWCSIKRKHRDNFTFKEPG
jgi:hypothetical protein